MSPVDPRTLRSYVNTPRDGGTCWNCNYELTGLVADICPECGTDLSSDPSDASSAALSGWARGGGGNPSRRQPRRFASKLGEAPLSWLKTFYFACLLMVAGPILAAAVALLWFWGYTTSSAGLALPASFIWYTAAYFITRSRPRMPGIEVDVKKEWAGLRWSTRGLQTAWILAAALYLADALSITGIGTPWHIVALVLVFIGLAGLTPMLIYLANLMDWADDTEFAYRIRGCSVLVAIGIALTAAIPLVSLLGGVIARTIWAVLVVLFIMLYIIMIIIPTLYILYSMVQIMRIARWAIANHATRRAIDDRLKQKALEEHQRGEYERWRAEQQQLEASQQPRQSQPKPSAHQQPTLRPTNPNTTENNDSIYAIEPDDHPRG